jgi:uncharacterized protein (TIGR01777 family)
MNILVSGTSGLIGSSLCEFLSSRGHCLVKLTRRPEAAPGSAASWNSKTGEINLNHVGTLDAAVHLAGEPIAQRWSREVKQRIRESRVNGTQQLCEALVRQPQVLKVLVCASACGFYGDRGDERLDETSAPGNGFLAEVSQAWEAATALATARGIRVVNLRFGIVLAREGGALKKMLPSFRLGLGGKLSHGRAYWSWIAIDDALGAIEHILTNEGLRGPVNVVSPSPVTNKEFTRALGRVLHRPTVFTVPRFVVERLFGEMGREALLASFRVRPAKLIASGYQFQYPELESSLRHVLT